MKLTNLQYVQSILSSLGSDEVNSVGDTTESLQVLEILRTTYFNMINRLQLPEHNQLIQLDPSLDLSIPVLMYVPNGVSKIKWIKYFNDQVIAEGAPGDFQHSLNVDITSDGNSSTPPPGYQYVSIIPMTQFIEMTNSFNPENSNVLSYTFTDNKNNIPGTYTFYYKNNKQPQYCTIVSDYYILFDGYNSATDDTLKNSKTMCEGSITPTWSNEDSFYPNIDEEQVPLLLNEAKSLAFFELKQSAHPKAEQEARRQWHSVQRDKAKIDVPSAFDQLPDFGRRTYTGVSYFKSRGWDRS